MSFVAQELRNGKVYSSNAQKVLEAFKDRFDKVNATKIYHMNTEISSLTQGISNVSIYYSKLNDLWAEFESIIPYPSCDCARSRLFVEFLRQQKLMKFLMGLNDTYAPQRSQIIMMNPTPTLDQAYSMLIQEKTQRMSGTLMSQSGILGTGPVEGSSSALAVANATNIRPKRNNNLYCDYCHMKGHKRENCYKLVGYPSNSRFDNRRRSGFENQIQMLTAHNVSMNDKREMDFEDLKKMATPTVPVFTAEQYQQILKLLSKEHEPTETANMEGISNTSQGYWIINSGASNHMASSLNLLDLFSGMVKGIGRLRSGLYILNPFTHAATPSITTFSNRIASSVQHNFNDLWHQRLGHAPVAVLQKIPSIKVLVSRSTTHTFSICPLAKQVRLQFPTSITRSNSPFSLVHMDVWGPYRVPAYNGFKYFLTLVNDYSEMTWTFFLRLKSDVYVVLLDFLQLVHNQFSASIKVFRCDNGHEFFNSLCSDLFKSKAPDQCCTPSLDFPDHDLPALPIDTSNFVPSSLPISPSNVAPLRRSGRTIKPPIWLTDYAHPPFPSTSNCFQYPIHHCVSYSHLNPQYQSFLASFSTNTEPSTLTQASKDDRWVQAMKLEIKAL
ncbi:PREDICTED: uncharacterized protein LOC109238930 [Nicotiana attenuata]|uniref:uncharacterized protein LOC109238930 n=1 Tax=Nicotiana attenuata TaxID=49451 RepID=UPI00090509EF|nr:PREDICTED: uncharacterized protein LOC109238930 [Nicotiana attenuata]